MEKKGRFRMARIKVKLFASLSHYLPDGAVNQAAEIETPDGATIGSILSRLGVPPEECHLVLVNGHFVPPSQRTTAGVAEGDTVSVWPPVAGG